MIEIQQSIWEGCLWFHNIWFYTVNVCAAQYQKLFANPYKQHQRAFLDQVTWLKYPSHEVAEWCMNDPSEIQIDGRLVDCYIEVGCSSTLILMMDSITFTTVDVRLTGL